MNVRKILGDVLQLIHKFNVGILHDVLSLIKAMGTIETTGRYTPKYLADESLLLGEDLSQRARETPEQHLEILRDMRNGKLKLKFNTQTSSVP